jgi:DNA-binding XRE family transcriptional regulator
MDDVVKRREARRRKILENTQNRLNRIIGIEQKTIRTWLFG